MPAHPLENIILEALRSRGSATREQLLELTFRALEEALASLLAQRTIRFEQNEAAASHLDRFVLN